MHLIQKALLIGLTAVGPAIGAQEPETAKGSFNFHGDNLEMIHAYVHQQPNRHPSDRRQHGRAASVGQGDIVQARRLLEAGKVPPEIEVPIFLSI